MFNNCNQNYNNSMFQSQLYSGSQQSNIPNNSITNLLKLVMSNPSFVNGNPLAKEGLSAIANGDNAKGEQIANNILASTGLTKEEAIAQIKQKLRF